MDPQPERVWHVPCSWFLVAMLRVPGVLMYCTFKYLFVPQHSGERGRSDIYLGRESMRMDRGSRSYREQTSKNLSSGHSAEVERYTEKLWLRQPGASSIIETVSADFLSWGLFCFTLPCSHDGWVGVFLGPTRCQLRRSTREPLEQ